MGKIGSLADAVLHGANFSYLPLIGLDSDAASLRREPAEQIRLGPLAPAFVQVAQRCTTRADQAALAQDQAFMAP